LIIGSDRSSGPDAAVFDVTDWAET